MSANESPTIDLPKEITFERVANTPDRGFQEMVLNSEEDGHIEHMCKKNPNLGPYMMNKVIHEHGPKKTMCLLENEGLRGKIPEDILTAIAMRWRKHLGVVKLYNKYVEEFPNIDA